MTPDALQQVPLSVAIAGRSISLEVEAWRSFQPTVGTVGDPLIAVLRVQSRDGSLPGELSMRRVFLLRGGEVVEGEAREEQPRESNAQMAEFVLRQGPPWTPGDSLDVVVELAGSGSLAPLLRAPRVAIARVD